MRPAEGLDAAGRPGGERRAPFTYGEHSGRVRKPRGSCLPSFFRSSNRSAFLVGRKLIPSNARTVLVMASLLKASSRYFLIRSSSGCSYTLSLYLAARASMTALTWLPGLGDFIWCLIEVNVSTATFSFAIQNPNPRFSWPDSIFEWVSNRTQLVVHIPVGLLIFHLRETIGTSIDTRWRAMKLSWRRRRGPRRDFARRGGAAPSIKLFDFRRRPLTIDSCRPAKRCSSWSRTVARFAFKLAASATPPSTPRRLSTASRAFPNQRASPSDLVELRASRRHRPSIKHFDFHRATRSRIDSWRAPKRCSSRTERSPASPSR